MSMKNVFQEPHSRKSQPSTQNYQTPMESQDIEFDLADLINIQEMKVQHLDNADAILRYRRALKGFPAIQETDESSLTNHKRPTTPVRKPILLKQKQQELEDLSVIIPDGKQVFNPDQSQLEELKASLSIIHSHQDERKSIEQQKISVQMRESLNAQNGNAYGSGVISDRQQQQESNQQSINEIIVKVELKKFQNLIQNKLKRKNNLTHQDPQRIFPLNKIADGTAQPFPIRLDTKIKSVYKLSKNKQDKVLSKECLSSREVTCKNSQNVKVFDFSETQSRPRTRQKSEVNRISYIPPNHWFNRNFEEPQVLKKQNSLDYSDNVNLRNQTQVHSRQKSAIPSHRQRIRTQQVKHRVNQSANFQNQDFFITNQEQNTSLNQINMFQTKEAKQSFYNQNFYGLQIQT